MVGLLTRDGMGVSNQNQVIGRGIGRERRRTGTSREEIGRGQCSSEDNIQVHTLQKQNDDYRAVLRTQAVES